MIPVDTLSPVLVVTVAIGTAAAIIAWRERPEPGATPLVLMLAGQCWWSVCLIFQLEATTLGAKIFWEQLTWVGVVTVPVAWLLFALEYTGRDHYIRPRNVGLLLFLPCLTVLLAFTSEYHGLLYVDSDLVAVQGTLFLQRIPGPWYWAIAAYAYFLGALGTVPLLELVRSHAATFRGQSIALLVGTIVPWLNNALHLAGMVPVPGTDLTPIAFAISGVAYLGALTRFRLFGTSPSPNQRARRYVFEQMQEGAIVVDSHDYLVGMNDSAATILGTPPAEAIGRPAEAVVPDYETMPSVDGDADRHVVHSEHTGKPYDVSITRISDIHDRPLGRVLTFHDISEHRRQQQRHQVLNRVFRHNIRTETNLIISYAELLADEAAPDRADNVVEGALRIEELAEQARTIVDIFEYDPDPARAVSLAEFVDEQAATVREAYPEVTVECETVPPAVRVASVLDPVVENVLENAAEHNDSVDPRVTVECEVDDEVVRLSVTDNGPGIEDYEQAVLERGTESPLEHGSGLGLWLITWGVDVADGSVTFAENDPTGSIVTIEVPILARAAPTKPNFEPDPV
jgi:PAS domain S-box-containing protein